MRLAQLPMIACGALLFYATERAEVSLPMLYGAIFCISVSFAFDSPARQALVPSLVPLELFPRAVTYSATAQAFAFASGPAIGGMLIASGGVGSAYAAYGVLVALNLIGLGFVRPVREAPAAARAELARGARGHRLRAPQPDDLGLHDARHVRGDLRRRDGAAADLRDRHPARRRARLRVALVVARDRRLQLRAGDDAATARR